MRQVKMHEAKTHLSRLADEAAAGKRLISSRQPVAKLVPLEDKPEAKKHRDLGFLKGKLNVPDDFDTMLQDDMIAKFEGRE